MKTSVILTCFFLLILLFAFHHNKGKDYYESIYEKGNYSNCTIELKKGWEFRKNGDSLWFPARVPGNVHTDLMKIGKIPDPYYRLNERELQWIDKSDWEYRLSFDLPPEISSCRHIMLRFDGLDTYADVYLNGILLLNADNMFRVWEKDCAGVIKPSSNELKIFFHSPVEKGLEALSSNGFPLPASMDQSSAGGLGDKGVSPFTRKAPYHYGWDWGPRLVTSGIWKPVTISGYNSARVIDLNMNTDKIGNKSAIIKSDFTIESDDDSESRVDILIDGKRRVSKRMQVKRGIFRYSLKLSLSDPELWWPNGYGEHHLYTADAILITGKDTIDLERVKFGIRRIELIRVKDIKGTGFYFRVNGVPVFVKGANYIPADVFLPSIKKSDYENLISSAASANMNMLRVWGGGTYESDDFYDLCDKYGIMIWQDFIFACSLYPDSPSFLNSIRKEAEDNVKRLRTHPSLAIWCGNNEIRWAWGPDNEGWGWKGFYSKTRQDSIWKNYQRIFNGILPEVISLYDHHRPYWESSPMSDPRDKTDYTFDLNTGDVHYWNVWQGTKEPISSYNKVVGRFMSEYGFQSLPMISSVNKFTIPEDQRLESKVMASHQRSESGYKTMVEYMKLQYNVPQEFASFLYISQLLQSEAIKTAIEAHRRNKPFCMGTLYWQLNDCWPAASWSGIDYYGKWKALHYQVKRSFAPFLVSICNDKDSIKIFTVSDSMRNIEAELIASVIDFQGNIISRHASRVKIESSSSTMQMSAPVKKFLMGADSSAMVLHAVLKSGERILAENNYYFLPVKDLSLSKPDIRYSIFRKNGRELIEMVSSCLVKNLYIFSSAAKGFFTDNFFDLLPGEKKIIEFIPEGDEKLSKGSLDFMSVFDTY